jgi:hypothetical protein
VSQTVGPVPVSITYAGNSYYAPSGGSPATDHPAHHADRQLGDRHL